jgi:hypothetical protein
MSHRAHRSRCLRGQRSVVCADHCIGASRSILSGPYQRVDGGRGSTVLKVGGAIRLLLSLFLALASSLQHLSHALLCLACLPWPAGGISRSPAGTRGVHLSCWHVLLRWRLVVRLRARLAWHELFLGGCRIIASISRGGIRGGVLSVRGRSGLDCRRGPARARAVHGDGEAREVVQQHGRRVAAHASHRAAHLARAGGLHDAGERRRFAGLLGAPAAAAGVGACGGLRYRAGLVVHAPDNRIQQLCWRHRRGTGVRAQQRARLQTTRAGKKKVKGRLIIPATASTRELKHRFAHGLHAPASCCPKPINSGCLRATAALSILEAAAENAE